MNWIRERREQLGLNQEEMTAQLQVAGIDIGRSTLSTWETGRARPPLDDQEFRYALSRVLRLPVREILKRSGYEIIDSGHSDEAEQGAYIIDQLDDEMRRRALRLLEALL